MDNLILRAKKDFTQMEDQIPSGYLCPRFKPLKIISSYVFKSLTCPWSIQTFSSFHDSRQGVTLSMKLIFLLFTRTLKYNLDTSASEGSFESWQNC